MSFLPEQFEWLRSHFYDVPAQAEQFCGDLSGLKMLNVGCGEMLTDFGLLQLGVHSIVGLDIDAKPGDHLEQTARKLSDAGIAVSPDYSDRLTYVSYDGTTFPFDDETFDFVFSWSAFEHVADVLRVLQEIRRVLLPNGRAFVQVYPWYHCRYGSHLSDFIEEPFFHLHRPADWVASQLDTAAVHNRASREFLDYMFSEYNTLNRHSANMFYEKTRQAGFITIKAKAIAYEEDLSHSPAGVDFSDLMICGTQLLMKKTFGANHQAFESTPERLPPSVPPT